MKIKIFVSLAIFLANLVCAALLLVGLLIALNGYNESDAQWGLGAFVLLAFLVSIAATLASYYITGELLRRKFKRVTAFATAAIGGACVGFVLQLICAYVGVSIAELVRTTF